MPFKENSALPSSFCRLDLVTCPECDFSFFLSQPHCVFGSHWSDRLLPWHVIDNLPSSLSLSSSHLLVMRLYFSCPPVDPRTQMKPQFKAIRNVQHFTIKHMPLLEVIGNKQSARRYKLLKEIKYNS